MANEEMATKTIKNHPDGGTYTELAFAETCNRWGISITRWTTYRNNVLFEVHRVSPDNKAFRLDYFSSEADARAFANKMWARDR